MSRGRRSLCSRVLLLAAIACTGPLAAGQSVTEAELLAAQQNWGAALVNISTTYDQQGQAAAAAFAGQVIDSAYGYQIGPVLFKPTLATGSQTFRTTRAGALAYFVGGDPSFPGDTGFALKGWRNVTFANAAIFLNGTVGMTMGNVYLTDKNGQVTVVDKTWTFVKGFDGKLRIMAHHSSLPYVPSAAPITQAEVLAAQQAWGAALVNISTTYDQQGQAAAAAMAAQVVDGAYGYQYGPVLFKPTLATGNQTFRTTRAGALAYFVGGDPSFPGDTGFALKGWRNVTILNSAIFLNGTAGTTMGNVYLTDKFGKVTVVDKTWMFVKGLDGKLRIMVHHSSLPYVPAAAPITRDEVLAAQQAWGAALVNIATTYDMQGQAAAAAVAGQVIDGAYGYQFGPVLFKPTLTTGSQTFRTTRAGALAYFVGGDPAFPTDTGFALKGWRNVAVVNSAVYLDGDAGTTMGNVYLTDKSGKITVVDKTWMFVKGLDGKLRIMVHHSSLPYVPAAAPITQAEVLAAQQAWGAALVNISTTYDQQGQAAAAAVAAQVIDGAYGYQYGPVLFKPTLTTGSQTFRTTRAGALAYFVGGNPDFPSDTGFALKGWRKVDIVNSAILMDSDSGTTMGNVFITDKTGAVTVVDKTWMFVKGSDGKLRIMVHHSSLPYFPATPSTAKASASAGKELSGALPSNRFPAAVLCVAALLAATRAV